MGEFSFDHDPALTADPPTATPFASVPTPSVIIAPINDANRLANHQSVRPPAFTSGGGGNYGFVA